MYYLPTCSLFFFPPVWVFSEDYAENRMVRTRSLSKISSSMSRQQYVDTSDEDEYPRHTPMYQQPPHRRKNSRTASQENLGQAPPVRTQFIIKSEFNRTSGHVTLDLFSQINELNKRMSAIESLLSRLEEKMTPADEVRQEVMDRRTSGEMSYF